MDFETIEDSIINELKTQVSYLKTVETYAGQLEQDIEGMPVRFPAAYVAYDGSNFFPGDVGGPGPRETCTFSVFVCARNLKGQKEARKEPGGAYDMVKDLLAALVNKNFGLDIEPVRPMRVSLLFAGKETAIYSLAFITGFEHA
jgi:phage gp37-like protein